MFAGAQSLRFTSPKQAAELSNGVARAVSPERDLLFLRWYSKFDSSFDVVGSSHNGGGISAHYSQDGKATPGVPADGKNKFLVEYECWRGEEQEPNPGNLNAYIYHPEQRSMYGDHFFPNGDVLPHSGMPGNFGRDFVKRPNIVPTLGRWYAYEVMLRANTPGRRRPCRAVARRQAHRRLPKPAPARHPVAGSVAELVRQARRLGLSPGE